MQGPPAAGAPFEGSGPLPPSEAIQETLEPETKPVIYGFCMPFLTGSTFCFSGPSTTVPESICNMCRARGSVFKTLAKLNDEKYRDDVLEP